MASPSPSTTPNPSLVTNVQALRNFLATIGPSSSIYVDLEGTNLGRGGTLDLITVLVPPDRKVRIIDVNAMGNQAFTTPSKKDDNVTLKSILEDPSIRKYLWDVRNDADALKSLYHVAISGVIDLQLLENLTRQGNSFYVIGLDKAVENDLRLDQREQIEWKKTKEDIRKRMASGDSGIFSIRPFTTPVLRYCAGDVQVLPLLRKAYETRPAYTPKWWTHLENASAKRVKKACSAKGYDATGATRAVGPWGSDPAYFFRKGKQLGLRATSSTSQKGSQKDGNQSEGLCLKPTKELALFVLVESQRQATHHGLGSTLIPKLASLMKRVMP
ncbi:hypothetical protein QC763_306730 [Podospora pseudopauciseta]|uniref:3'-5' exonuclease domain-containing protein n=1 Tax=Podospora pseudopauciseta TaxID=2093780 RepID=A0ABR0HGQ8_9PEZI|nr:hypothetical protein QC763_306730 [Podospora pseudopauciseta]